LETLDIGLLEAAGAGLLSFLSPCVLPLVIPYLAYVGGVELSGKHSVSRPRALLNAIGFVLGFASMFVLFGASAGLVGALIAEYHRVLAVAAGGMLVFLGLQIAGVVRLPWLAQERRLYTSRAAVRPTEAFVVGVAFAFGWSPCIGPVLAAVLTLAVTRGSLAYGILLLGVYGLAMAAPFLLGAIFVAPLEALSRRISAHVVIRVMAGLIIVMGMMLMTDSFWRIGTLMIRAFPFFQRFG
jgi:cytochrome c-type biogenesis protein